jgi:branched-chain amino acid transport system permease protein
VTFFLSLLVNGLMVGAIYALVALGFVLVFKSTGVVNFAQGELVMLGGYIAVVVLDSYGVTSVVGIPATLLALMVVGLLVERSILRPMIGRPVLGMIMATIGLAFLLRGLAPMLFGPSTRNLQLPVPSGSVRVLDVNLSYITVTGAAASLALLVVFTWFFQRTRTGVALRAVSDDQQAAAAVGISVPSVFAVAMAIAGLAAGAGGLIWGGLLGVDAYLALVGLRVFPVVILGGLDSIGGAIIGGLVVGAVENVAAGYIDPLVGGGTKDFIPYLLMLAVLMIKPYGLFGRVTIEKV